MGRCISHQYRRLTGAFRKTILLFLQFSASNVFDRQPRPLWLKSKSGFSLVQTLVAIAIMSIVTVGTFSMIDFQNKSQTNIRMTIEAENYVNELKLQASVDCTSMLTGAGISNIISPVKDSLTNITMAAALLPTITQGMSVTATRFRNKTSIMPIVAPFVYTGVLEITINKGNADRFIGPQEIIRSIPMNVVTLGPAGATPNLIISCNTSQLSLADRQQLCTDIGGTWDVTQVPPCNILNLNQAQNFCTALGGTLSNNGTQCSIANPLNPAVPCNLPLLQYLKQKVTLLHDLKKRIADNVKLATRFAVFQKKLSNLLAISEPEKRFRETYKAVGVNPDDYDEVIRFLTTDNYQQTSYQQKVMHDFEINDDLSVIFLTQVRQSIIGPSGEI